MWALAEEILNWAENKVLSLSGVHLNGELNKVANYLSREKLKEGDWILKKEVFRMITQKLGVPQVDLFASKIYPQEGGWRA